MADELSVYDKYVIAQALGYRIKAYFSPSTGCYMCQHDSQKKRSGCDDHAKHIQYMRELLARMGA